jgi:hypothetical protein
MVSQVWASFFFWRREEQLPPNLLVTLTHLGMERTMQLHPVLVVAEQGLQEPRHYSLH